MTLLEFFLSAEKVISREHLQCANLLPKEKLLFLKWCLFFVFFSLHRLLNVLEVIAPFKHFNKLREFVQMKLPPGFPVKLGKIMTVLTTEGTQI